MDVLPINVLIVDDHQIIIDGLKSLLKNEKTIKVIGEANNGNEAIAILKKIKTDVVIADISMPEMGGIELTKIISEQYSTSKVLVLSMHFDSVVVEELVNCGVSGYVLKNTGKKELMDAITQIHQKGSYFSAEVAGSMLQSMISNKAKANLIAEKQILLTTREKEIVKLIAQEYSNAAIAEKLFISEYTVETHRKNIFRKTNAKSVVGLMKFIYENNLV